jgi:SSS family solute:Na+ symporter
LYTISLAFIFIAGFAALLLIPGLSNGDLALLMLARKSFPPWFLGVIGGAGALTAMVPAAIILLTASTLFAKNVFRPICWPRMPESRVVYLAKTMVLILGFVGFYLALHSSATLVALLLIGYSGVSQFFPGVILGLFWRRVTTTGVLAGLIGGLTVVSTLMLSHQDPVYGLNAGFIALTLNFAITLFVSLLTGRQENRMSLDEP